jgi:hypothetical protein
MPYELNDLFDLFGPATRALALYLADGCAPVIAWSVEKAGAECGLPMDHEPPVDLFVVEGPKLNLEDLRSLVETIKSRGVGSFSPSSDPDMGVFRVRDGSYDFVACLFVGTEHIRIEFRQTTSWQNAQITEA